MEFKVVKINEQIKNVVVFYKVFIESDFVEQCEVIIVSFEKGQVFEGFVKNIIDFGVFFDFGGVDGLLYIIDIFWGCISYLSEVLLFNQKINVVVFDFDENKKWIFLGLKQLQLYFWDVFGEENKEGFIVRGKIVNIEDYGVFFEIQFGVEGLIYVFEVSWSNQLINVWEYFKFNQEYDVKIVIIDWEDCKMFFFIK